MLYILLINPGLFLSGQLPDLCRPGNRMSQIWKDNIKVDLKEIVHMSLDRFHLTCHRVQWSAVLNTTIELWAP